MTRFGSRLSRFVFVQTFGSKNMKRVGVILQRSSLILLLVCLPCWAILINSYNLLLLMHQDDEVARWVLSSLHWYWYLCVCFLHMCVSMYKTLKHCWRQTVSRHFLKAFNISINISSSVHYIFRIFIGNLCYIRQMSLSLKPPDSTGSTDTVFYTVFLLLYFSFCLFFRIAHLYMMAFLPAVPVSALNWNAP